MHGTTVQSPILCGAYHGDLKETPGNDTGAGSAAGIDLTRQTSTIQGS